MVVVVWSLSHFWLLRHHQLYVACQVPLSMGLSRQEYWSGLPFHSPGDLPNPEIKPSSPMLQADFLLIDHLGSRNCLTHLRNGTSLWYISRSHLIANEESLFVFYENVYPWRHYSTSEVKHLIQPVNTTSEQLSNWKGRQKFFSGLWPSERSGKRAVWNKSKIKVSK